MNRIKDLRLDRDKTQAETAAELGYYTTTYARWEQNYHNIKLIDAINIAHHYNISLDYIAGLIDEPRPLYPPKKGQKKHG